MNTAAVRPAADPTAGAKGPASMTRLRGLVIGNCQAHPLATALNIRIRDITFKSFGIHQIEVEIALDAFRSSSRNGRKAVMSSCVSP